MNNEEAIKNIVAYIYYAEDIPEEVGKAFDVAIEALKNERQKGEWIEHYSEEMSERGYFLCSKCKCGFQRFARGIRHSNLPWIDGQKYELKYIDNFCPNCGADMREADK